jgi:hypothetical protein
MSLDGPSRLRDMPLGKALRKSARGWTEITWGWPSALTRRHKPNGSALGISTGPTL